jgi:hypothetical protein
LSSARSIGKSIIKAEIGVAIGMTDEAIAALVPVAEDL